VRTAQLSGLPIVAAGDVLMHVRSRKPLQDTLTATRLGKPVHECGLALEPNAEQHLRSRGRLAACTSRVAREHDGLRRPLLVLARRAEVRVPAGDRAGRRDARVLAEEAGRGRRAEALPDGLPEAYRRQIEDELAVIAQLQYEAYFLTVADIVAWARAQNILCQGRGSAANSLVCYCLHVTEVDPRRATLLFGRFISVERNEPPDIDIDFEHQRREEVIQYIYGKYGRHRAALTAVVISYRPRSALRDVGRRLGIDLQRIDAVAKMHHWFDGRGIAPDRLREGGFDPDSPVVKLWMELTAS
jgi:error-prone DNA polymerase